MNIRKYIINAGTILLPMCFMLLISSCSSSYVPLNPGKWYDAIISSYKSPPSVDGKAGYVVVKKGDTLYSIAKKYNTTTRSLIYANNLHSPYNLQVGQKIYLPSAVFHVVKKGDTLYDISRRYNVDSRSLAKANNLTYPYSIYQGQKLILPSAIESGKGRTAKKKTASTSNKNTAAKTSSAKVNKTQTKKNTTVTTKQTKTSDKKAATATKTQSAKTAKSKATPIPTPPPRSSGKFTWPHDGKILLGFGDLGAGRHNDGINIKAKEGDSVKAADNGVVAYAGNELKGFGNLILLKHSDGWITAYAHNSKILVKKDAKVKKGQVIAKAGQTGNVQSPQVHFEVRQKSKAKDPLLYLEKKSK